MSLCVELIQKTRGTNNADTSTSTGLREVEREERHSMSQPYQVPEVLSEHCHCHSVYQVRTVWYCHGEAYNGHTQRYRYHKHQVSKESNQTLYHSRQGPGRLAVLVGCHGPALHQGLHSAVDPTQSRARKDPQLGATRRGLEGKKIRI